MATFQGFIKDKLGNIFLPNTTTRAVRDTSRQKNLDEVIDNIVGDMVSKTGSYPSMTAGTAMSLIAKTTDSITQTGQSFIGRTTAGSTTIPENGITKLLSIKGNLNTSTLATFKPDYFLSVGSGNQWDGTVISGYKIDGSCRIVADSAWKIAVVRCVACESGSGKNNGLRVVWGTGYVDNTVGNVGYNATVPEPNTVISSLLTASAHGNSISYLPTSAGFLLVSVKNTTALCVRYCWSGYNDNLYEAYSDSRIVFPMPLWGLTKLGTSCDEVTATSDSTVRLTKRNNRIDLAGLGWQLQGTTDQNGTTYYNWRVAGPADMVSGSAYASNHGGFSVAGGSFQVLSESGTTAALNAELEGKYAYYIMKEAVSTDYASTFAVANADFGSEWFIGTAIAPSSVDFAYAPDYVGWLRDDHASIQVIELAVAAALNNLAARIGGIESLIKNGFGSIRVEDLTVTRNLSATLVGGNCHLTGTAAPNVVPDFVGQNFYDTTNKKKYTAFDISSASDWVAMN